MSSFHPATAGVPALRASNSVGFLRVFLAVMVIFTHAFLLGGFSGEPFSSWTGGELTLGTLAVQSFFVLSGWMVALSWLRSGRVPDFLWRRFLRLAPALWACLIFTALVLGPLIYYTSAHNQAGYFSLEPSPLAYIWQNLIRPRSQIGIGRLIADTPWGTELNGSLWTLFYEGACYLAVAAAGVIGLISRRKWWVAFWIGAMVLYVLAAAGWPTTAFFDTPGKLLCFHFATGVTWALIPEAGALLVRRVWAPLLATALLAVGWILGFGNLISPLLLPIPLFWLVEHLPFRDWERRAGGDYSYGLYIYGYPVHQTLAHFGLHQLGFGLFFVSGLFVSAGLAWASWHGVEKPAQRLRAMLARRRPGSREKFKSPASGLAVGVSSGNDPV